MPRAAVTIAVVGAGSRGTAYSRAALRAVTPAKIVAIAEPRAEYRRRLADDVGVDETKQFDDWRELVSGPRG